MQTPGGLRRDAAAVPGARACRGCRSSAASASVASWPTTWAWARRSSCCRCYGRTGRNTAVGPDLLGPSLLICPMSLVGNWQREAERFTPDLRGARAPRRRPAGRGRAAGRAGRRRPGDHHLPTSRPGTWRRCRQVTWARVVCDEAQAIKNHATSRRRRSGRCPPPTRIALTGTPVENQLSELWSIMEFTNPGLLGPAEGVPRAVRGADRAARLGRRPRRRCSRITQPFVLRRLKTDKAIISDLPDKQEMKVWCNLTQEQASLYAATVTDMLSRIEDASDDISRRGLVLATMAKLKQVCNHPGAPARRRLPAARAVRQAGPAGGDLRRDRGRGRQGAVLHPVRRVRPDAAAAPGRAARLPGAVPARRHEPRSSGTRW